MRPTFSLIHATARIPGWKPAVFAWRDRCDRPESVEHVICADKHEIFSTPTLYGTVFADTKLTCLLPSWGSTRQYNGAAEISTGRILIQIADDLYPSKHWDTDILQAFYDHQADIGSPYVLDQDNGDHSEYLTHAIMTRAYYERFNYIGHPDYHHLMEDVEFTEVARASGCVLSAKQIRFKHLNPEAGTADWDDVYRRQRTPEMFEWAKALFERRKAEGFPAHSVLAECDPSQPLSTPKLLPLPVAEGISC